MQEFDVLTEMPIANSREEGPVTKRQRLTNGTTKTLKKPRPSRIFAPYRTLGLVSSTEVPFTSIALGRTTFQITTSVGRCLHTYDLRKGLHLTFITRPQTPSTITATRAWKDRVYAAWGGGLENTPVGVWVFKRGKRVAELQIPKELDEQIKQLVIFGSWIVGCCSTHLEVWKSATYEHYTSLTSTRSRESRREDVLSGVICNMPTLLNKILAGRQDGKVELWNLSTGKLIYTIAPPTLHTGPVTALQPTPALSFVAIARADGSMIIHDVRADKEIIKLSSRSMEGSNITSITFRTDELGAGDDGRKAGVVATAGTKSGDVTLWDLNEGGRVMGVLRGAHNPPSLSQSQISGGVSKIEFLSGQPVLVSSGLDNSLKSWIFDEAPFSPIPRILHCRSGHAAVVTRLEFLPVEAEGTEAIGKWLLSAGRDQSLWGWSIRRDGQSTELSQGNIRKKARRLGVLGNGSTTQQNMELEDLKAPEVTCLACSLNRDGGMGASTGGGAVWANVSNKEENNNASNSGPSGWESIVTGHKGDKFARTWFWGRKKAGRWAFETGDGSEVKSVEVTPCGTFALVGSANGGIDMFNLQSGIHRQKFPAPLTPAQARKLRIKRLNAAEDSVPLSNSPRTYGLGEGKHVKAVTGILVDGLNRTVISCSLDGKIKFWDFPTGILRHEIDWYPMTAITASRYHRPSDLIAFSCDDLSIRVVDIETRKLVRELWGCVGRISDFCFSNDGRWIIASSMDAIIRVWDLPTGHLIDATRLESACTALAFSTTGEFLATAHADSIGISIWTNRTLFTHVPTRHIGDDEIIQAILPTASGEGGQGLIDAAFDEEPEEDNNTDSIHITTDQLSEEMMTLSLVPRSRWQTLLHLDTISQRNKPTEPPTAPEKAPFFLPSLEGPKSTATSSINPEPHVPNITPAERSRISKLDRDSARTDFTTLLHSSSQTGDFSSFIDHLKTLSPSTADLEIRSLSQLRYPTTSTSTSSSKNSEINELVTFIQALVFRLRQKRDYELVQAWMAVFLRIHGESIPNDAELVQVLKIWREEQEREGTRLGEMMGYCSGVLGYLRSGR